MVRGPHHVTGNGLQIAEIGMIRPSNWHRTGHAIASCAYS
jgi:hypothetical protein